MALKPILGNLFAPVTEGDWRAAVAKSRSAEELVSFVAPSDDNLPIGPIHPASAEGAVISGRAPGKGWTIIQRIDHHDLARASRQIQEDIAGGAGGIELVFASSPVSHGAGLPSPTKRFLEELLRVAAGSSIELRIDAGEATPELATRLLRLVQAGRAEARTTLSFDPIATLAAHGRLETSFGEIGDAIAAGIGELDRLGLAGAGVISDGRIWHAAGASEAQELAAVLAGFVAYARILEVHGVPVERAAARVGVTATADADEFLTIAKFRAVRLLLARALELAEINAGTPRIHAETSWRMLTRRDPHVNLVRSTTATFAAGAGGADSVTVLPFTGVGGVADSFARRMARNTQMLLLEESNIHRVGDPGAGSGAIEALTDSLAAAAWEEFRAIEAEGGLLAAVHAGSVQAKITAMREARLRRIATREIEITGVNTFPDGRAAPDSPPAPPRTASTGGGSNSFQGEAATPLVFERLAGRFEGLRDRADRLRANGRRPNALLVTLGPAGGDAAFAAEMLACGGIDVVTGKAEIADDAANAFAGAGASIAVIAAPSFSAEVAALAASLRAKGARRVLLAGPSGEERSPHGVDHIVRKGNDMVAILSDILDAMEG